MNDLSGKTAVITGGNSGMGYATAKKFKANGANVIITGRSAERVEVAAKELGVKGIVADVGDLSALDDLAGQVKNELGQLDILFVNAGIFAPAPIGQNT
jgi:NAD(P)-dependent dehydrogenase (short-subunit alcohol dehydrogenase family)